MNTPRTDALAEDARNVALYLDCRDTFKWPHGELVVPAAFAYTLEREIARLTAENEELRDRLVKMRDTLAVSSEDEERRLREENAALRKDAMRYQWLKAWGKTDGFSDEAIDREIAIDTAIKERS